MMKKYVLSLVCLSLIFGQMIFPLRQSAAESNAMFDTAMLLPESDVVIAMDFERTLNVAAPAMLDNDARKIENLKKLMTSIENRLAISPYQIKQIAIGYKLPPDSAKDYFKDSTFAAIIRTADSNADLLDKWAKRMNEILIFDEEKKPSKAYIDKFRNFRGLESSYERMEEKRKLSITALEEASRKLSAMNTKVDALPKVSVTPAAVSKFKQSTQNLQKGISKVLTLLKSDTDTKKLSSDSIKLQNRWNGVMLDDPQRKEKLAAIYNESKALFPVYKTKIDALQKTYNLLNNNLDNEYDEESEILVPLLTGETQKISEALDKLPTGKAARIAELNSVSQNLQELGDKLDARLNVSEIASDTEIEAAPSTTTKSVRDFYQMFKSVQKEKNINGKKMIVFNPSGLDAPLANVADNPSAVSKDAGFVVKEIPTPEIAIGFIDDKTVAIGLEKSVTEILNHNADYKNQKAVEMIDTARNSLFAFAVNSNLAKRVANETGKSKDGGILLPGAGVVVSQNRIMESFLKDVNVYGSVNYNVENNPTNDVSMTVGFFKDNVIGNLTGNSNDSSDKDSTFDLGGFQVSNRLFYDLLGSFKAMNASITFKFEKKKLASLIRSTPRIIDSIGTKKKSQPKEKIAAEPKRQLNSLEDIMTTPELYVEILKTLGSGI